MDSKLWDTDVDRKPWDTDVDSRPWSTTVARRFHGQIEHSVFVTLRFELLAVCGLLKVSDSLAQSGTAVSGVNQDVLLPVARGLIELPPTVCGELQQMILFAVAMGMHSMDMAIGAEDQVVESGLFPIVVVFVEKRKDHPRNARSDDYAIAMQPSLDPTAPIEDVRLDVGQVVVVLGFFPAKLHFAGRFFADLLQKLVRCFPAHIPLAVVCGMFWQIRSDRCDRCDGLCSTIASGDGSLGTIAAAPGSAPT